MPVKVQRLFQELEHLVEDQEPLRPDGVVTDGDPELGVHQGVAQVVDVLRRLPQLNTEQFFAIFWLFACCSHL